MPPEKYRNFRAHQYILVLFGLFGGGGGRKGTLTPVFLWGDHTSRPSSPLGMLGSTLWTMQLTGVATTQESTCIP